MKQAVCIKQFRGMATKIIYADLLEVVWWDRVDIDCSDITILFRKTQFYLPEDLERMQHYGATIVGDRVALVNTEFSIFNEYFKPLEAADDINNFELNSTVQEPSTSLAGTWGEK
jgi:hypothetical protein